MEFELDLRHRISLLLLQLALTHLAVTACVPSTDEVLLGAVFQGYSIAHYDGCIRRVNVPTALRSPPKYYAISICEQ